jgi:hypothetical protein
MIYFLLEGRTDGVEKLNAYLDKVGGKRKERRSARRSDPVTEVWGEDTTALDRAWKAYEAKLK